MRAVGLKVLKNKLSEYVRLVAGGETVLITDRDRVVAEMVPPRAGRSPFVADAMLADAVRKGWITPPTLPTAELPPRKPIMTFEELMRELEQDRADRDLSG
jgi:antitoxin (DNA-binding transcriptional repressor) of toxin-antitoxin stability system